MIPYVVAFVAGAAIGSGLGILGMCIFVVAARADEVEPRKPVTFTRSRK